MAARQVVGDCILDIVDIGHPIIAADVAHIEEIEAVKSDDDTLEVAPEIVGPYPFRGCSDELITDADVDALVSRRSEP